MFGSKEKRFSPAPPPEVMLRPTGETPRKLFPASHVVRTNELREGDRPARQPLDLRVPDFDVAWWAALPDFIRNRPPEKLFARASSLHATSHRLRRSKRVDDPVAHDFLGPGAL